MKSPLKEEAQLAKRVLAAQDRRRRAELALDVARREADDAHAEERDALTEQRDFLQRFRRRMQEVADGDGRVGHS